MNIDLLKKLLPGEVNEYLVRKEVRADGRDLQAHRPLVITRAVMANNDANNSNVKKVSCAVKLGQTHVLCSLIEQAQDSTILQRSQKALVSVSLTLAKDTTSS